MYIPILKNRTIEISALKELLTIGLNEKVLPMLEIIQEKSRSNSQKNYIEEIGEIFKGRKRQFFLDILKINITGSTAESVQTFMTMVNRQRGFFIEQLMMCKNIEGMVPVLSYNSKDSLTEKAIISDIDKLKEQFECIALRLNPSQYNKVMNVIKSKTTRKDYLILDIDDKGHTNPAFKLIYRSINSIKKENGFRSFIVNSNRPTSFYNKNITNGEAIEEIDNSLREMYKMLAYKFDGFGDYACISNSLPSTGGAISPAGIYYSKENNFFIGYKGRRPSLSEFSDYIAPQIMKSVYWNEYDENHHNKCPGCVSIKSIVEGKSSGKSQAIWKGISMSHYIYTINELLHNNEL